MVFLPSSSRVPSSLSAPTGGLEDRGLSILEDRADNPSTPKKPSGAQSVLPAVGKGNPKNPFPLDDLFKDWLKDENTQKLLAFAAQFTDGGYEGFAQVAFDFAVHKADYVTMKPSVREVPVYVYSDADKAAKKKEKRADFVFDSTETTKGLIVELKCENKKSEGATFISNVKADVAKLKGQYKDEYKDYTKVAIAMAWSQGAEDAFGKGGDLDELLGVSGMPKIVLENGRELKVYRLDVDRQTTVEDVNKKFEAASISDPDCDKKQKRSSPECQIKNGSSNPKTGIKDNSGNEGKAATAGKKNKAGKAATANQPAKAGKKNKAVKPAKAG